MKVVITHPYMTSIVDSDQRPVNINEIDNIEDSSCIVVNLTDCMDYIPFEQRMILLTKICAKVRSGGEITISGADLCSIGHYINNRLTSVQQINISLFTGRLSCDKMYSVLEQLKELGFSLVNAKIDGLYYSIKGERKNGNQ